MKIDEKEKKILELLRSNPQGLTITQISERLGIHRVTVIIHLNKLVGKGLVIQRKVGPAKLNYFINHYSDVKEESEEEKKTWEKI